MSEERLHFLLQSGQKAFMFAHFVSDKTELLEFLPLCDNAFIVLQEV